MSSLGPESEGVAADYLKKKEYKIIHRNYRTPLGEADIVAKHNETVVFVEVKARSSDAFGQPFEAVDHKKQERLKRISLFYLTQIGRELPVRFDVISIVFRNGRHEINHIVEAF